MDAGEVKMLCVPKLGLYISDTFAILLLTLTAASAGCNLDAAEIQHLMLWYPPERHGCAEHGEWGGPAVAWGYFGAQPSQGQHHVPGGSRVAVLQKCWGNALVAATG